MQEVRAIQGDTVDRICYRYYGRTAGVTEAVLKANPGLAKLGPILPMGTRVKMPAVEAKPTKQTIALWE